LKARTAEIGEFVEVVSGPAFKSALFTDDPSDVPLIKGENIAQGYIAWEKSRYWPTEETEEYERFGLVAGDIVLAMDRPWVTAGLKWARLKPHDPLSLLVQRAARLRAKPGLRQDFLTYVIGSGAFSGYVRNIMGGTNVPHISGSQIKAFKFRLPGEKEQSAIASTLSAYDDLIENNRRRITLLEAAARLLYREWFVHFRFAGHEHVKVTDDLPEGWEWRTLGDIAKTNKESYRVKELPDEINYIDISSVAQGRVVSKTRIPASEAPGRARRKIRDGDTIWSNVRPNLRAYALMLEPEDLDVVSTGFTVLTATRVPSTWLYMFVTTENFVGHLVNHATGVGYPAVRPDDFERAELLLPPRVLLDQFHEAAEPNFRLIRKLELQNQKLAQARDLLLPRLVNGEVAG
jgi:type I restriction enzyme S subunit